MELFIFIWIVIGIIGIIVSGIGLFMNIDLEDEEGQRFWSRALLASFVWPLLLPLAFFWVVCTAFDREFPTWAKKS